MEEKFNVFFSTVCHFCKELPDENKFCSGCLLVQYCCKSHQREDWRNHKELCKCVQHILKKTGANHVYEEAWKNNDMDLLIWNKLRMSVIHLAELIMNRPLTVIDTQMFLFPPVCNTCHRYEQKQMISCNLCKNVMYCSLKHMKGDKEHANICKDLNLCFEINKLRFFHSYDFVHNISAFMETLESVNEFPATTKDFLKQGHFNFQHENILLSELLSYSLTLAFAIKTKGFKSSLTIHIVGADDMEIMSFQTLPLVFSLLPHLTFLKIILIGPRLVNNSFVPLDINKKCSVEILNNTLYHEHVSSSGLLQPDLIVVFNCGFCEHINTPEKDTWKDSLPYILNNLGCTVVLTSYTAKEADADLNRLCELKTSDLQYEIILNKGKNPFKSLYPHRDWETNNNTVFYVNNYISILNTYYCVVDLFLYIMDFSDPIFSQFCV